MKYIDQTLTFESDKVYYVEQDTEFQVMMTWEDSIMKASADYVCEGGGDILEIGFGMGISAGKDSLSTYDGVFYDTWADDNVESFTSVLPDLTKPGAKVTWWNNFTDKDDFFNVEGTTYQALDIKPVENMYFTKNLYYLPKKQF